jgi:fructosamine-3-kinase
VARAGAIARRAEELLGAPVVATSPVAGGDICTATRVRLADGSSALVKTRAGAPAGFFRHEAAGLRWLREAGGAAVPPVLAAEDDCLVLGWVETAKPTPDAAEDLGRALAATHAAGAPALGAGPAGSAGDGWIGTLPLPLRAAPSWPEFYATRRLLPYLKLARDRGGVSAADAGAVEAVVRRLEELAGPAEPPARIHGDLWWGNVLWGTGHRVHLVDPAAHGGHRETDLAMLALFGCPQLPRVLEAYDEAAPLADGWQDRTALHQLFPLLVHACMFGGGYGARAGAAARTLL